MSRSSTKSGFTLVELLVVIGIIALLISILLPSLARARESAETVRCLSNLKQIGVGIVMYANDNKGSMPISREQYPASSTWVYLVSRYVGVGSDDASTASGRSMPANSPFKCSSATEPEGDCHYLSNPYFIPCVDQGFQSIKMSKIRNTSDKVLLCDGSQDLGTENWIQRGSVKWFADNIESSRYWWDGGAACYEKTDWGANESVITYGKNWDSFDQGDGNRGFPRWRHNAQTTATFLFGDGHAEPLKRSNGDGGELKHRNWFPNY